MKKLFLFALLAALCCSCTESNTDENTDPNGGSNSGQTTPPDPDSDAKDVIHVPKGGMLAGILNELGLTEPSSLKLSGTLGISDFTTLRNIQSLEHLDISRVNLSVLPTEAFLKCTNIKSVTLPNTLTAIGTQAFCGSSLVSISIPAGVKTIGNGTFNLCTSLQTVTFEKGSQLKAFENSSGWGGVFQSCTSLTTIEIPASVETIGYNAFFGCSSLKTVTFEKGSQLKTIDGFHSCTSLTTIEIPASVETIKGAAFQYCTSLQTVTFEKGTKLKTIGNLTFCGCTSLTTIEIPASVETIGRNAFWNCTALTTVDMSACTQVTEIGGKVFYEDSKLQLFKIGTRIPPRCGDDVFTGINSYSVLKVPAGCVDAYKKAKGWKEFTTISELDE